MVRPAAPDRVLEITEEVARRVRRDLGPSARILWFGSWVSGNATERSDIDVAYDAGVPLDPTARARLECAVEDIPTLYTIDLVDLQAAGPGLRRRILEQGVAL